MIKKSITSALFLSWALISLPGTTLAFGPHETKRERLRREAEMAGFSQKDYEQIVEAFLREDFESTARLAEPFISRCRDQVKRDEIYYLRALSLIKLGRYEEARKILTGLGNAYDHALQASAAVSLADAYALENRPDEALGQYHKALSQYPRSEEVPYISTRISEIGSPAKTAVSIPEATSFYTVQVGAFSNGENAGALLNKLLSQHYEAYVHKDPSANRFRVRVGKLSNREEALALEARLKKDGYSTRISP